MSSYWPDLIMTSISPTISSICDSGFSIESSLGKPEICNICGQETKISYAPGIKCSCGDILVKANIIKDLKIHKLFKKDGSLYLYCISKNKSILKFLDFSNGQLRNYIPHPEYLTPNGNLIWKDINYNNVCLEI